MAGDSPRNDRGRSSQATRSATIHVIRATDSTAHIEYWLFTHTEFSEIPPAEAYVIWFTTDWRVRELRAPKQLHSIPPLTSNQSMELTASSPASIV
jgi:hypothetical protein